MKKGAPRCRALLGLFLFYAALSPEAPARERAARATPAAAGDGPASGVAIPGTEEAIRRYEEFIAKGDVRRARQALDAAAAQNPDDYPLIVRYAKAHYLLGEYPSAKRYFEHALNLRPRENAPLEGLFLVERAQGDPKWRSRASVLALSPAFIDLNFPLAEDLVERGEHREALKLYDAVLKLRPDDPVALTGRGWCRYRLGDRDAAQADFRRALALRPGHRPALQGIDATRRFAASAGYCFAAIDYRGNPFKRSGNHHCVPVSLTYNSRASASVMVSQTKIDWVEPAADTLQRDLNVMVGGRPLRWASLWVATNFIDSNDPETDGSHSWTGGFLVQPRLGRGTSLLAGAAISSTRYASHDLFQVSPRIGASSGWFNAALFASHILDGKTDHEFTSWGAAGGVGPLAGLSAGSRVWWGRRRGHVDDGGAVVSNSLSDTFLNGWHASLSYDAVGRGSVFLRYGEESLLADYGSPAVRYKSGTLAAGMNVRFGH